MCAKAGMRIQPISTHAVSPVAEGGLVTLINWLCSRKEAAGRESTLGLPPDFKDPSCYEVFAILGEMHSCPLSPWYGSCSVIICCLDSCRFWCWPPKCPPDSWDEIQDKASLPCSFATYFLNAHLYYWP